MKSHMYKSLLFIAVIALNFSLSAQNISTYFSNKPFKAGSESSNPAASAFNDAENFYGLIVIDQILDKCEDTEMHYDDFKVGYRFWTGAKWNSGHIGMNRTIEKDGKTYVFLDIHASVADAQSRSCKKWPYVWAKAEKPKGCKLEINSIEGECRKLPETKFKKISLKYEFTGAIKSQDALAEYIAKCTEKVKRERDAYIIGIRDAAEVALDEENKKSGTLPKIYYRDSDERVNMANTSQEQLIEAVKNCKCFPPESKYVDYAVMDFNETYVNGTNVIDYRSWKVYVTTTDKDGNCRYRRMAFTQHYDQATSSWGGPGVNCHAGQAGYDINGNKNKEKRYTKNCYYKCP